MSLLRLSLLTSCLILLISIVVACDRQKEAEGAASTPPTSLNLIFFGDKPIDMDKIIQEFYKRTSKTLNVKLNLEWDASEEYKKKVKLKLAAGEAIDAVFDASWMNLEGNVAQGYYRNLDYYFNNDEYPGLKKAFPPEFLEANKIDGHIFAIPLTNNLHDIEVVYIRKDIREQLGMDVIRI
jgi:putative aldouronate transport system substrate-binding protein